MARTATKPRLSTTAQLDAALADQARIEAKRDELAKARQAALLSGDKAGLEQLRQDSAALVIETEDNADLIAALNQKFADEEAERKVQARKDHEHRLLAKQERHRDAIAEIARLVGELGKAMQKAQALGVEVHAGWPWGSQDPLPLLLGEHLKTAVAHELYRTSGMALPGARVALITDPRREIIDPLTAKADAAIEYAKRRIAETPNRDIVAPAAPPPAKPAAPPAVAAVPDAAPVSAPATPAQQAPTMPPGEHAFLVQFEHSETGQEHVETILFGPDEFARCADDQVGVLGPAGRSVAIELAQQRAPAGYLLKPDGVRFDLARLIKTAERD